VATFLTRGRIGSTTQAWQKKNDKNGGLHGNRQSGFAKKKKGGVTICM